MQKIRFGRSLHALTLIGLLALSDFLIEAALSDAETRVVRGSAETLRSTDTSFALQDSVPSFETLAATIIGRTVEELRVLYPGSRDTAYSDEVVQYVAVILPVHGVEVAASPCTQGPRPGVFSRIPRGTTISLQSSDKSVRTRAGLGPGSSLGEIRAASNEVEIYNHETIGWWATMDGRRQLRFVLSGFDREPLMGGHKYRKDRLLDPERMPDSAKVKRVVIIDPSKCPESER